MAIRSSARRSVGWLGRLRSLGHRGSRLTLSQSLIVLIEPLAKVFLLGLEGGLRGIAIQVLAALAIYVGDDFCYFHRMYLCVSEQAMLKTALPQLLNYQHVVVLINLTYY